MRDYPSEYDCELPDNCVECNDPLAPDNMTAFCCDPCADAYCARIRREDDAYARDLAATEEFLRDNKAVFEEMFIEERMIEHFKSVPASERV